MKKDKVKIGLVQYYERKDGDYTIVIPLTFKLKANNSSEAYKKAFKILSNGIEYD